MNVKSILLIRLSAIGDIVMASGVIPALRAEYPEAEIDWMVHPECGDLVASTSGIREVIQWPKNDWLRLLKRGALLQLRFRALDLIRKLRSRDYDMVIDMQGLWKSGVWAFLSGSRERIGLGSREGSGLLMDRVISPDRQDVQLASEYKLLLREMGVKDDNYGLGIEPSAKDRESAREKLEYHALGECGYAVVCPFTTREQKHWQEERWVELIREVQSLYALPLVLLGGPGDREAGERLQDRCGNLVNLAGKTALMESLAIILQSVLLIGVDTGLTHVGSMSGVPTVALFGATCPYRESGNPALEVIYNQFPCSPCRRKPVCGDDFTCMQAIQVRDVLDRVERLQPWVLFENNLQE
ncbi:MAG: glycosyltransferase family 9 protein [Thermodesulfobacteriota bacterium]